MTSFVSRFPQCVIILAGLVLASCSTSQKPTFVAKNEPWRAEQERACLASGFVRQSPYIRTRSSLGGPSVCGAIQPFQMSGAARGRVLLEPAATLRCNMIPQVERWVTHSVMPAARRYLGMEIAKMRVAASYACRPINHKSGAKLSEHGRANALDISSFTLVNGHKVTVKDGWRGHPNEQAFLRAVHRGACQQFTTVLGPNADRYHHDHFHMDLARHGRLGNRTICR